MIKRTEWLIDNEDGSTVVMSIHDSPRLAGWPDVPTASAALRAKAKPYDPEPLICGGYETRKPNINTGLRERVTFWPDTDSNP